jgi:uncharacterized protein YbaR (Trm112 family)
MGVKEIIVNYLITQCYDGLCGADGCSCGIDKIPADTQACFDIIVLTNCPHCKGQINLFEFEDRNDHAICHATIDRKSLSCEDFNEKYTCPHCKKAFIVKEIIW